MNPEIAQLKARVDLQRRVLTQHADEVGKALNVPRRLHRDVREHPYKWAAITLTGGLVVARVVPIAFGVVRAVASRRLAGKFVAALTPLALRAGLAKLQEDRRRAAARRGMRFD